MPLIFTFCRLLTPAFPGVRTLWPRLLLGLCLGLPVATLAQRKSPAPAPVAPVTPPVAVTAIDNGAIAQPAVKSDKEVAEETEFTDAYRFLLVDEPTKAITALEKMVAKNPANAAAQYALAAAMIKAEKSKEALPYAQKAYQLDKNNAYYLLQVAELYVKQKRYTEAEELYESLLAKGSETIEYGVELAAIYLFDDKPDKALATYDRVEKAMGLNEEITRQKQRIYLKQNKVDKAIEEAEKLIASEPADPEFLVEGAELLVANDRVPLAITWLERALKLSPDSPEANMMLADIYRRQGDVDKSNQAIQKLFANPNLEAGLKARILSSYVGASADTPTAKQDALKMAQELSRQNPNDAKSQVMMADLLMQQGQKAEARDAYARAARLDPSIYEVWGAIVQLDGELSQIDSILVHTTQALEVFPNQGLLWYSNGAANLYKRRYQEAVDALEESRKLLSSNEKILPEINGQLGDAYNGLREYPKSNEAYEAALKIDPANDRVLNNYSYFLSLRKENLARAKAMSTKLAELHPANATYLDTHAWVLYVMKDYAAARKFLEKAIQSDPANVSGTILEHYGDALFQLGDKAKAIEQWKLARQKGGASDKLDQKIAGGKLYE
ncbi:tetratricopeptide repeat protein [Fibrella aquatica]|uniref:tetratricopeptide repeat protein n=1 Tax=Fibrella aquatica TaxID=3242487 RepID=UPI00351FA607